MRKAPMNEARAARPWLALAMTCLVSASSCGGGTTARRDKDGEITAGSGSLMTGGMSSGGVPVNAGGTGIVGASATGGSAPSDAGVGGASIGASDAGGSPGGAGGADACDTPGAPGCFSCCEQLVCPVNAANCDANPSDCETVFGAKNGCTPVLATVAAPSYGVPTVNVDGSYFVAGRFIEATDFDPGPAKDIRTPASDQDAYVSKFSPSGTYIWTYTFGKSVEDFNVASGADASAVVAGALVHTTDAGADPGLVYTDAFITRLGADGRPVWQHMFNAISQGASSRARVATDSDGSAILWAGFSGDVDFGLGNGVDVRHFSDIEQGYLFELDAAGSMVWNRAIGGDNCPFSPLDMAVSRETIAMLPLAGIDCVIDGKPLGSHQRDYWPLVAFTRQGVVRDAWLLGGVQHLTGLLVLRPKSNDRFA